MVGALYTGSTRGLLEAVLACDELDGVAITAASCLVTASHGHVTDVLEVPSDTIAAQLQHAVVHGTPGALLVGLLGSHHTAGHLFSLGRSFEGPFVLNVTLSGPSGEDVADARTRGVLLDHLAVPTVVSIGRRDAELLTAMQIASLDDAQVAAQRLARRGAAHVVIRCGRLKSRHFDPERTTSPFATDLYFDGESFSLFEAPWVEGPARRASARLHMALLRALAGGSSPLEGLQLAKGYVTERLRAESEEAFDSVAS